MLRHDSVILKKYFGIEFPNVRALDTLMLSSLMYPRQPYHKLRKEYLQSEDELDNPLKDAELSKTLLEDCINKWNTFPWQLQELLYLLLKNVPGFAPFFLLVNIQSETEIKTHRAKIQSWFIENYEHKLCLSNFENEWQRYQTEWAFLLTLFFETGATDFVPEWVRFAYPHIESILRRRRMIVCKNEHCKYCSENLSPIRQLEKWFTYKSFRKFDESETVPIQELVVESALQGESLLAVFPTGGGKSLTFQLPAFMAGAQTGALTVVISPIVALMKDQVDVLQKRHQIDNAAFINSMLSPLERKATIDAVLENKKDLLYISPESLRSNTIFKMLLSRRIDRIVIDEAHCFSSWGHDFRVDYLYVADFIKDLQTEKQLEVPIPISCFTATAKQSVVDDICNYFKNKLNITLKKFISSATRTNLDYSVINAPIEKNARKRLLINLIKQYSGPKIVYASKVKTTVSLAENLRQYGFKSECYNGKMESEIKSNVQEAFQKGDIDTIVATTAFGMGVDKDNVELVAHYELSSTLESYVQEAGRAGRNPKMQAFCVALYNPKDLDTNFQILQRSKLSEKEIGDVWNILKKLSKNKSNLIMSALEIADKCGWTEKSEDFATLEAKVKQAIMLLEDRHFLTRGRNCTHMYGSSISIESVEQVRKLLDSDSIDKQGTTDNVAFRIMRHIITKRWTKMPECALDDLTINLGIETKKATEALRLLRSKHLLEEQNDFSANVTRGSSKKMLNKAKCLEDLLIEACKNHNVDETFSISLTKINSQKRDENSGIELKKNLLIMRGILRYWAHENVAEIHLVEAGRQIYIIEFLKEIETIASELNNNWTCFESVIDTLLKMQKEQEARSETLTWFSINSLIAAIYGQSEIENIRRQKQIEFALLFLHLIGSITLNHGLMVFYTGLRININPEFSKQKFSDNDFEQLREFYENKAEAIHIVGKYAEMMLQNKLAASNMLNDYFLLSTENFRKKYMLSSNMRDAISDELRLKINNVDKSQAAVIKSRDKHILVGAGPGSGKTHLLVHKAASLLWLEEIQPTSLLMLTFTRAACRELKKRLFNLAGALAQNVTITTFHALAFSILGVQGKDILKSSKENSNIFIDNAAEVLESGEDVGIGALGVILVDEYQDLSAAEYRMLKALYNLGEKNTRIIVVGDDDQNIYEFRGSSSKYFKMFADEFPNAKKFFLTANYRSAVGIVRANEYILQNIKDRVKNDTQQVAVSQEPSTLEFYEHKDILSGAFAAAELLKQKIKDGSSACILSRNNDAAFLAAAKLEELNLECKILKGQDKEKCQADCIREIIGFKELLENTKNKTLYSVSEFKEKVIEYKASHKSESDFLILDNVIKEVTDCVDEISLADFLQYLDEISFADLVNAQKANVNVGSMHSSKGLEWDNVILNLCGWNPHKYKNVEEEFRLLYVACTRAKKSITVLGNEKLLPAEWLKFFDKKSNLKISKSPNKLHVSTSIGDLNLGHLLVNEKNKVRTKHIQQELQTLPLATNFDVKFNNDFNSYNINFNGRLIAAFSKKFHTEFIEGLNKNGYFPKRAMLQQVCKWVNDDNQEIWVPLFNVEFIK